MLAGQVQAVQGLVEVGPLYQREGVLTGSLYALSCPVTFFYVETGGNIPLKLVFELELTLGTEAALSASRICAESFLQEEVFIHFFGDFGSEHVVLGLG